MKTRLGLFSLAALTLVTGCSELDLSETDETARASQALTTVTDVEPWITVLTTGLPSATYKDIASSGTQYYVLTTTGIKQVNHGSESQIINAPVTKTIALDAIDYTNSTWNVVGARSKGANPAAQVVLKAMNAAPVTVNLPSDVTTVTDLEARAESASSVRLFIHTNGSVVREYVYNGTLTSVRSISWGTYNGAFVALNSSTIVHNHTYPHPKLVQRNISGSTLTWNEEALKIDIDNTAPVGQITTGQTTAVHVHGFNGTVAARRLSPARMDYSSYNNAPTSFYSALVSTGANSYDLVRFNFSYIQFNKQPARSFTDWNGDLLVQKNNNCYNYAANRETGNFAQPGYASTGTFLSNYLPASVTAAVVSDGLEAVAAPADGSFPVVPEGKTLVAAISGKAPNYTSDYHWYRRDSDGNWTHKPGGTAATNLCYGSASPVTDPRVSSCWNPNNYDTFVGFFLADDNYYQTMGVEKVNGNRPVRSVAAYSDAGALEVTFSIYSGRPNPVLRVTDRAVIQHIADWYAEASRTALSTGTAPSNSLGAAYFGVYLENIGAIAGLPEVVYLNRDHISAQRGLAARAERTESLSNTAEIETYLLNLALESGVIDLGTRERISTLDAR
jgi:hypothetical protein